MQSIFGDLEIEQFREYHELHDPHWHVSFWAMNWTWQYAVIGGATVCIAFYTLKAIGLFGTHSEILQMLEEIPIVASPQAK